MEENQGLAVHIEDKNGSGYRIQGLPYERTALPQPALTVRELDLPDGQK